MPSPFGLIFGIECNSILLNYNFRKKKTEHYCDTNLSYEVAVIVLNVFFQYEYFLFFLLNDKILNLRSR